MKKKLIITMCAAASLAVVAAAVFGLLAVFRPAPAGDAIVRIGKYPLSEQELRAAMLSASLEDNKKVSCEKAARRYVRVCIEADEIAGTKYAVEKEHWKDYEANEAEGFDRDYDLNMDFCQKNNITRDDVIVTCAMASWEAAVQSQHIQMTVEQMHQRGESIPATEDFFKQYYNELDQKAAKLRYVVLDPQAVQALDGFGVTHIDYEPE